MDYLDFKDYAIGPNELFMQKEDLYYVFAYYTYCPHCNAVKREVFNYANQCKNPVYFLKMDMDKGAELFKDVEPNQESKVDFINRYIKESIGANKVSDIGFYFVPTLFVIQNHILINMVILEDNISSFLQK